LWRAAVEENVLDALENLITFDAVKEALEAGEVRLHGFVYDLAQGHLNSYDPETNTFTDVLA
jgi:carbonic anhydrase